MKLLKVGTRTFNLDQLVYWREHEPSGDGKPGWAEVCFANQAKYLLLDWDQYQKFLTLVYEGGFPWVIATSGGEDESRPASTPSE